MFVVEILTYFCRAINQSVAELEGSATLTIEKKECVQSLYPTKLSPSQNPFGISALSVRAALACRGRRHACLPFSNVSSN